MNKMESCVETPAAPEWLSKLESRREKLSKAKLGHESGAGAPCNECGPKCPGLDLHFWRKVCRNCKCRKDQHLCTDDDFSGWAQFEILGQIRSKPAYMKIKALADNPVKLEWVPPNVTPDLVSDYMDKLGSEQIPIEGSDAAAKRKQQLEFQVPPHDLDAELCDNLTESETNQLQQYVKKIRESCVGQGNVVRVGNIIRAIVENMDIDDSVKISTAMVLPPPEVFRILNIAPSQIVNDKIASEILSSQKLINALLNGPASLISNKLVAFNHPNSSDFQKEKVLNDHNKFRLSEMNLNKEIVKSLVENGPLYDNLIHQLKTNDVDISHDPILAPIEVFRRNFWNDNDFQQNLNSFVDFLNKISPQYATPIKSKQNDLDSFHSPVSLKNPIQTKFGAFMKQETPMRKVKFGEVNVAYLMGFPVDASVERDSILSKIINSESLLHSLQSPSTVLKKNVILSATPMIPDFHDDETNLTFPTLEKLEKIGVNKEAVQSGVLHGPFYDKLFENLKNCGIKYADCKLLAPIEEFREEFLNDIPFQKEITEFIETIPNNFSISCSEPQSGIYYNAQHESPEHLLYKNKHLDQPGFLSNPQSPFKSNLPGSKSSDSGFESKPPTPNFSTFPGVVTSSNEGHNLLGFGANAGKFTSIPGLEDMNMYPHVQPSNKKISQAETMQNLNKSLDDLHLQPLGADDSNNPVPVLDCKDCGKCIMSGEVAVKADRAGKEVGWHPQCFKCHKCRELLADLVYFFHGGNVFCGRDLAEILKIPRCNACDELIFTKEYTAAEGATFHIKHFCCYQCDTPLAGQGYVPDEKTNMPLCLMCYDEYYAERCQTCKHIIGPSEQGVKWGKVHWHGICFNCAGKNCGKSLIGGRFCVKNNMPFCSPQCVKSIIF